MTLILRKPGWTEQSKVVSECILKCDFFMQTVYCKSKRQVIFSLDEQSIESEVFDIYLLAGGHLQLYAGKLHLADSPLRHKLL